MFDKNRAVVSVKEAAKYLSLGLTKTNEMIVNKEIDSVKIGGRRLIKVESLRKLLGEDE